METLKRFSIKFFVLILMSSQASCNLDTLTVTYRLETDTYISSQSESDNSDLSYLSILRSGAEENRALFKLPTGDRDGQDWLDECLSNVVCFAAFLPITIWIALIAPNCDDSSFTSGNLNWAYLAFDTVDGSSPAAGALEINLVSQPWWHSVTWTTTHPFSQAGRWQTPGGAIDSSVNFEPSCTNLQGGQSCGTGEVKFEMTDYFRSLLDNPNSTHYGMVIRASADMPELRLHSVQTRNSFDRPRLVANYNCITPSQAQTSTYYFGNQR